MPEWITTTLVSTGRQLLFVLGPLVAAAVLLHITERLLSSRLASRLGGRSVLLTGWIGVPVHELSHAAACWLFGHQVRRIQLFTPHGPAGQLGSVTHSYDPESLWQQAGRFFIGIAPLVGGAVVLWVLTWTLGPEGSAQSPLIAGATAQEILETAGGQAVRLLRELVRVTTVSSYLTWVYLYLSLCVAAHMSPSQADLKGGWPGFELLLLVAILANLLVAVLGGDVVRAETLLLQLCAPLLVLLVLALALQWLCLAVVWCVTACFRPRQTMPRT